MSISKRTILGMGPDFVNALQVRADVGEAYTGGLMRTLARGHVELGDMSGVYRTLLRGRDMDGVRRTLSRGQ